MFQLLREKLLRLLMILQLLQKGKRKDYGIWDRFHLLSYGVRWTV